MILPRRTLYFRCNWLCRNERCPNISDEARTAIAKDNVQNDFVAKNTVNYSSNKKLTHVLKYTALEMCRSAEQEIGWGLFGKAT